MKKVSSKAKFFIFVALVTVISLSVFIGKSIVRNNRITNELTEIAESYGLNDVKIIIGDKISGHDFYDVTVDSSNFADLSYSQMFSLSDSLSFANIDAFVSEFTSGRDSYKVYSSTKTIYKNGSEIYNDYWNSQSYKDATKNDKSKSYRSSSNSNSSRSYTPYKRPVEDDDDKYNAKDYKFAEDFYDDHYDDFYDFEDAEDYFNEHND